jgi:membrane protein DedA with SNARE-associated domain
MVVQYEMEELLPIWACVLIAGIALLYTIAALRWIFKRRKSRSQSAR